MDSFFTFTLTELETLVQSLGVQPYRARQIYNWVYQRDVLDFHAMSNLPKSLRNELDNRLSLALPEVREIMHSADGSMKFGLVMNKGHLAECVLMPEKGRHTLCISSQIGCKMACQFCVTGQIGFVRDLSVAEIVGQVMTVKHQLRGKRITNIVFMGMGEPLDNVENVLQAIEILQEPLGLDFSHRRLTVSTVGLIDGLRRISPKKAAIAISLNAASESKRTELMPINRIYSLRDIVSYVKGMKNMGRQRVFFEYVLLKDVNDSPDDARALAKLLAGVKCKVNLIPYNESPYTKFHTPSPAAVERFQAILIDHGFTTLLRDSRARDIGGGCGQLGMKYLESKK